MTKKTATTAGSSLVRELAEILDDQGLVELEYATDEVEIRLSRASSHIASTVMTAAPPVQTFQPMASEIPASPTADHPGAVNSPMVGTAYLAPEPGADDFIKVGDSIKAGQTLLIIEAMKVMNPITAEKAGVVKTIMVSNAQPVEYGEALLTIE